MHNAGLADSIDAARSLLDPARAPWQFEMHDRPAPSVKVQPFSGRIRGEQACAAAGEPLFGSRTFLEEHSAVQHADIRREIADGSVKPLERVPEFCKHDDRLFDSTEQAAE